MIRFDRPLAPLLAALALAGLPAAALARQPTPMATPPYAAPASPEALFGDLYARVQTERLFADNKTFADATPREAPAAIMAAYAKARPATKEDLRRFVEAHFDLPVTPPAPTIKSLPLREHIAALWPILTRPPLAPKTYASALPLSHPYVVPGGRFREIYYWDAYFTLLGMVRDGQQAGVADMVDNFADILARYGHIPNGTRTYYLTRSQPPFFYQMVALLPGERAANYARYLTALKIEHAYWMLGADALKPGQAAHHSVRLSDGTLLNRYWDESGTPRDESYGEDVALAAAAHRPSAGLYHDIRAAAEAGWDFSSRWFADGKTLATIETTSLAPVDLNSLMVGLEQAIAEGCRQSGDGACAQRFADMADKRAAAIRSHLWNAETGAFEDLNWRTRRLTGRLTAATLFPLYTGIADPAQADRVAATVEARLLRPGGIATTTVTGTGQQWDEPNGWAPLQWIAVTGLDRYGHAKLADTIASRWVGTVNLVYNCTGRLVEKYDVDTGRPGGGGEYPVQDGFGWTNGVTRALLDRPAAAQAATATACPANP